MALARGFSPRRPAGERGFTLIELLVVISIISILAGIAIPVFLRQRAKGFRADVTSALKSASTAAMAHAVAHEGSYAGLDGNDGTLLTVQGYRQHEQVLLVVSSDSSNVCVLATHLQLGGSDPWKVATLDSSNGVPSASDVCVSVPTPAVPVSESDPEPSEEPSSGPTVAPSPTPSATTASASPSATPTPTPLVVVPTLPPIDLPDCNPPVLVTLCD